MDEAGDELSGAGTRCLAATPVGLNPRLTLAAIVIGPIRGCVDDRQVISFMIVRDALSRVAAALGVVLVVGCSNPSDGTSKSDTSKPSAESTNNQVREPYAWLTSVLPTDSELSDALGYPVVVNGLPKVRDGARLRNTFIGSRDIAERDCIGVVSPLETDAYVSAPLVAVTFASESAATYSAALFDSPRSAEETFNRFAEQWRACDGRTVVKSGEELVMRYALSDVRLADRVTSAVVTALSDEGSPVVTGRALGVAQDCLVEVELGGLVGSLGGGFGGGVAGGVAGGAVLGPGGAFVGALTGGLFGGEVLRFIGGAVGSNFDR
ncbi:sensor domain-containing protein [Mycobacterium sp. AMU20-3851]|uniref:sensor domain-containing protein n=1 Tax=Mycobacterium sp. AMU20-3851 TaxID=3122055 RepID=UPI0037540E74